MVSKEDKKRILEEHHRSERRNVKLTLFFMFLIVLGAILILIGTGVVDRRSGDVLGRADLICFLSGFPNGVDADLIKRNGTGYMFECNQDKNVTIEFDKESGKGIMNWNK